MYEQAIQLDPSLHIAYTNLGNIYFRRGRNDQAHSLFTKALELNPEQSEALYNLGYLELENGFAAAAIPLFRRSIKADPSFSDAWFNLAMALEQCGKPAHLEWQRYLSLAEFGPVTAENAKDWLAEQERRIKAAGV